MTFGTTLAKVLDGTQTLFHLPIERRYVYLVGKVYSVQAHRSKDTVASIKITSVKEQLLGAVTEEEARAEGFESLAEFKASWDKRFGPFDLTQDVRRVEFRLVDKSELGSYDLYKLERVKRKRLAKETYPETSEAET